LRPGSDSAAFQESLLALPCLSDPLTLDLFLDAAEIYREGRRRGYTIRSGVDCLIAAIAIHHGVQVWHRDRDFDLIAKYTPLRVSPSASPRVQ
jgi:predicted nucleic acid-binding protein